MKASTRKLDCLDMLLAAGSPGSAAAFFRNSYAEQENHRLTNPDSVTEITEISNKVRPCDKRMQCLPYEAPSL